MGRTGLTLRSPGECLGPERGAQPSGKPCAVGGLEGTRGSPRGDPEVFPSGLKDLGRGRQGSGEGTRLSPESFASPFAGHECVVLSSVAHRFCTTRRAQKKTCVWATSPFSCREQNSGHMAQAACTWHLASVEHWLCAFDNVSKPCFQTMVLRAGRGEDSALLPEFADAILAGSNLAAWAEREPSRPSF